MSTMDRRCLRFHFRLQDKLALVMKYLPSGTSSSVLHSYYELWKEEYRFSREVWTFDYGARGNLKRCVVACLASRYAGLCEHCRGRRWVARLTKLVWTASGKFCRYTKRACSATFERLGQSARRRENSPAASNGTEGSRETFRAGCSAKTDTLSVRSFVLVH